MKLDKKEKLQQIIGEIAGYFMSQKGRCGKVVMPTEFLIKKTDEIEALFKKNNKFDLK